MAFWIFGGVLTLGISVLLIVPLVRTSRTLPLARSVFDTAVYNSQLSELKKDRERGLISRQDAESAKTEIQRQLIRAAKKSDETSAVGISTWAHRSVIASTVLLLPAAALGLYLQLGVPGMPDRPLADRGAEIQQAEELKRVEGMVERLAERMKKTPDDSKGWAMLGRSYRGLNRFEDSGKAYARAYELTPEDMGVALDYGETLVFADQGYVNPTARALFEQVLAEKPNDVRARFYYGLALSESTAELPCAIEIWEELLKEYPAESPWSRNLRGLIQKAKQTRAEGAG